LLPPEPQHVGRARLPNLNVRSLGLNSWTTHASELFADAFAEAVIALRCALLRRRHSTTWRCGSIAAQRLDGSR
jgi:hypothetical protein